MTLAQSRDDCINASAEDIANALEGEHRPEHLFVLGQAFHAYPCSKKQIQH